MPYRSRWSVEQKIAIVMESLNTNISVAELCRKHNVTPNSFYGWKEKFLEAGKLALAGSLNNSPGEELEAENESLKKLIGELYHCERLFKKCNAGRRQEKMRAVELTLRNDVSLRKALSYSGPSSSTYYYEHVPRVVAPDPLMVEKVKAVAFRHPTYGTRRIACHATTRAESTRRSKESEKSVPRAQLDRTGQEKE